MSESSKLRDEVASLQHQLLQANLKIAALEERLLEFQEQALPLITELLSSKVESLSSRLFRCAFKDCKSTVIKEGDLCHQHIMDIFQGLGLKQTKKEKPNASS